MEEEGGRNRGREGVLWWWNHTHEWPTKRFVLCCRIFAAQSDCRTSLLKRKHNNVIIIMSTYRLQHTILHQPATGRQKQNPCACCIQTTYMSSLSLEKQFLRFPQICMCHSDCPPPSIVAVLHESGESYPIEHVYLKFWCRQVNKMLFSSRLFVPRRWLAGVRRRLF